MSGCGVGSDTFDDPAEKTERPNEQRGAESQPHPNNPKREAHKKPSSAN